jgi:hypothetical protein
MILKVNGKQEKKLAIIANRSNLKPDDLYENIIKGFIDRYEQQHGKIQLTEKESKLPVSQSLMYDIFKKHHFQNTGEEYIVEFKQRNIDIRNLKLLRDKIVSFITQNTTKEVVTIDEESAAMAFEFVITKMPDWWKANMFTPSGIYKNFEKIVQQIKNGRQGNKASLDDYLNSFTQAGG